MGDISTCRSCGKPVLWLTSAASGKRMPVNAQPEPLGGNILPMKDGTYHVIVHTGPAANLAGKLHLSHFATCPAARDWRSAKGRKAGKP